MKKIITHRYIKYVLTPDEICNKFGINKQVEFIDWEINNDNLHIDVCESVKK